MGSDWWCDFESISCYCYLEDLKPIQASYLSLQMMNPVPETAYHVVTKPLNILGSWITGKVFEDQPVHHAVEIYSKCGCSRGHNFLLCEADGQGGLFRSGKHKTRTVKAYHNLHEDNEVIRELMNLASGFRYDYIGCHTCQTFAQDAWEIVRRY